MNWSNEIAKEFKERNNINRSGVCVGKVISVNPLKISILDGSVILSKNLIYVCSNLLSGVKKANIKLDSIATLGVITTSGEITFTNILKVNDLVMCVPTENEQKYFIVDKVVM
ncbi:MAG: DUF2577 domain-containing protein [Clostridium sp.]